MKLSFHTAPKYPNLYDFGSCEHSGDNYMRASPLCESQEDSSRSSCCGFHRGDVTLFSYLERNGDISFTFNSEQ